MSETDPFAPSDVVVVNTNSTADAVEPVVSSVATGHPDEHLAQVRALLGTP